MLLWPSMLFVLVTPHIVDHALQVQADFLLDEFFALSALLLALWIRERNDWQLGAAALFLGAAMMTKREGYVLGVCALLAAAVVTSRQARSAWPKLLAVGVIAAVVTVPWRALLVARGLEGGGPEAGGVGLLSHADRAWPSLRLTLSTLFDFHIWHAVVPILVLAIAASYLAGERQVAAFAAALAFLCVAAFTWSTWAFPSLPITKDPALNPIVRFSGALILMATWLIPLLLTNVERTGARRQ
jgi:Dolichyl-phosphate-mannose-protein mannosyltransferase